MDDKGRIKGVPIQHFLAWWEHTRDPATVSALAEPLEAAGFGSLVRRDRPTLGILPSVWYPSEFVHTLLDGLLVGQTPQSLNALAAEASEYTMEAILKGIYRALFSLLATPDRYPKYAQRIWDMHYDSGELRFEKAGPREHTSSFQGWRGHHPFICMLNVQSARPIYRAMDCSDVEVQHLTCVSRGDPRCSSRVRWSRPD